jgi:hypothetical protein
MIDLDQMDEQLASALIEPPRPPRRTADAPPHVPPAPPADSDLCEMLELGLLDQVDARIDSTPDRGDRVTWATMRALLDGREDAARSGLAELLALARATDDAPLSSRYWSQRFWCAYEWGSDAERYDVLDHCRERAYRFDDLGWWGNLTLLLATLGKADEASRAFDATWQLLAGAPKDRVWLDVVTNLIEGAAVLGDVARTALVHSTLVWPEGRLVVVGPALVCKGSVDRYRGLGFAAAGMRAEAGHCFSAAAAAHRAQGARPLLARTLHQAESVQAAA